MELCILKKWIFNLPLGAHSHNYHGAHPHDKHGTHLHEGHGAHIRHDHHAHGHYQHSRPSDENYNYTTDDYDSYDITVAPMQPYPQSASAIHHENAQKSIRKGVGFDPSTALRNYEDTKRKGHSKHDSHKLETEIDLSGEHGKRIFCKNLISSLYPLSLVLNIIGRFPLSYQQNAKDSITYDFFSSCQTMKVFHFNLTTIFIIYALISGLMNVTYICIDVEIFRQIRPQDPKEQVIHDTQISYDKALIQRNAVPLIIILFTLLQALISSLLFTKKHDYLAHIFSFINKLAETKKIYQYASF